MLIACATIATYRLTRRHLLRSEPRWRLQSCRKETGQATFSDSRLGKKLGTGHNSLAVPAKGRRRQSSAFKLAAKGPHQHHVEPVSITFSTPSAPLNPSIALAHPVTMAENNPQPVASISRTTRPMSEALLNEKVQIPKKIASILRPRRTLGAS